MAEVTIRIRWSDMDAYGHVNNAVYLNYLEECRDRLAEELFGDRALDFVLAHVGIDYRKELTQSDEIAVVRCWVEGFGTSSIRTKELIVKSDGSIAAEAESVIVPRDTGSGRSRPLTATEIATLEAVAEAPG